MNNTTMFTTFGLARLGNEGAGLCMGSSNGFWQVADLGFYGGQPSRTFSEKRPCLVRVWIWLSENFCSGMF